MARGAERARGGYTGRAGLAYHSARSVSPTVPAVCYLVMWGLRVTGVREVRVSMKLGESGGVACRYRVRGIA